MLSASTGFILTLSMIMPIGSQNSMLLTQGINKNHHMMTAILFIIYDAALISIGVLSGRYILASNELLFTLLTWGGVIFLLCYGAMSFKTALTSMSNNTASLRPQKSRKVVLLTSLMVTFLNPHAYIDTVMVIGSVGGQYSGTAQLYFLIGAITGSTVWFASLALGAAIFSEVLSRPKVKYAIDIGIGVVMWVIAWSLFSNWLAR